MPHLISVPLAACVALGVTFGTAPTWADAKTTSTAGQAVAGWIGRELAAGGGVLGSPTDWGLTEDAVFALAATGHGRAQITRTAQRIRSSDTAYIGTRAAASRNWARIAKTALALQVAGIDASTFPTSEGTRDLVQEVRGAIGQDGGFAVSDFPFAHSIGMLTLARTPAGVPAEAVRWLQAQQCRSAGSANFGGYGTRGCADVDADATAMSIQALRAAGVTPADATVADAAKWLVGRQDSSGGFPSAYGAVNTNTTGLAGQALRDLGRTRAAKAAAGFVTDLQVGCATGPDSAFTSADAGAIAYDRTAWDDARATGIGTTTKGQWLRASTQAALGLSGARLDQLTAAGATPSLPPRGCSVVTPKVAATAVAKKSAIAVRVTPRRPTGPWTVNVQRKVGASWRTVREVRVKGAARRVDLPRGAYRAVVVARDGNPPATSRIVKLAR